MKKLTETYVYTGFEEFKMIICCGEALIDMARTQVSGLEEVFSPHPGGSPYNTAIAIGKLGVPVKFLGRLSTDFFGELLIKRLRDNRVGDDLILRSDKNTSLAFVKLEKGKEPQFVFYTEGAADRSLSIADLPPKLPADTNCIVFGSISMTIEPIASAIETLILREGSRKNTDQMDEALVISFDPNIRTYMIKDRSAYVAKFEKWVASSTIVKISAVDFSFIYPKLDPEKALQKVLAMGPWLAICTLGTKGATAMLRRSNGSVIKVSAPTVDLPVVDTIGAGASFHGAFLSWLEIKGKMSRSAIAGLSEDELYDALFFANKAASIVCSRRVADPPSLKEVEKLKVALVSGKKNPPPAKKTDDKAKTPKNVTAKKSTVKTSVKPKDSKPSVKPAAKPKTLPSKSTPAAKRPVKKK
jgi:fructokinase